MKRLLTALAVLIPCSVFVLASDNPEQIMDEAVTYALMSYDCYKPFFYSQGMLDLTDCIQSAEESLQRFSWLMTNYPGILPPKEDMEKIMQGLNFLETSQFLRNASTPDGRIASFTIILIQENRVKKAFGLLPEKAEDTIPEVGTPTPFDVEARPFPSNLQPVFPETAQNAGITTGKVIVQVYVDKEGEVKKWQIAEVNPKGLGFEEEVEKRIPYWRFSPALKGGKPVGVWVKFNFYFK